MPNIPSNSFLRGAARQGANLLRAGAGLLDLVGGAGGEQQQQGGEQAEESPARPKAVRRRQTRSRTPGQAKERPRAKRTRPRADRQRSTTPKDLDDVTIARKVETEIFRDPDVPKGHISVNVADGVVYLRGEVKHPDDVNRLGEQAAAVPEVNRVENLLHLPGTPAPTRADTPAKQQKPLGRRTRPHTAEVHITKTENAEVPTPGAEESPDEKARFKRGRSPSKLGSSESSAGSGGEGEGGETPEATPPSARSVDSVEKDPEPAKRA